MSRQQAFHRLPLAIAALSSGAILFDAPRATASHWSLFVPGDWLHYAAPEDLAGLDKLLARPPGSVERLHALSIEPVESLGRAGIVVRAVAAR